MVSLSNHHGEFQQSNPERGRFFISLLWLFVLFFDSKRRSTQASTIAARRSCDTVSRVGCAPIPLWREWPARDSNGVAGAGSQGGGPGVLDATAAGPLRSADVAVASAAGGCPGDAAAQGRHHRAGQRF